ncbi:MAG: molecular chaperone HscC [Peptostreptococcaceae bacterium]|nr:molecular chaperone HscC [Peptostreptococcaceae bacterium]
MVIGIDLGTTNSLAAYFKDGEAKIIPNRFGENLTPSVVSLSETGELFVGKTAKERKVLYPDRTADVFKRSIGTDMEYKLGEQTFSAEELSSFVLRALKEDAEAFLKEEVTEAIISVPAYFNDLQRKATKRAGELAGMKVERIISEPTAAAITYGLYQKRDYTKFLVFDLGGGTFDISILERAKNILEVRAVAGDNYLGGEDFTAILLELFLSKTELDIEKLSNKEKNMLVHIAERAKLDLSREETKPATMTVVIGGEEKSATIHNAEYEAACQPLLSRIRKPIEKSLRDANIKIAEIDEIVLVGGATKSPIVKRFVSKLFNKFPNFTVDPDEAVAVGVAMEVAIKERNESLKEVIMTDVCPYTLGTSIVVRKENDRYEGGHYLPIIERNTVIPCSRTERLYTVNDNQTNIYVDILQGESRLARNNLKIGEIRIPIPRAKAGEEPVDVTYTYDVNAILEVIVKVVSTNESKKLIIQRDETQMTLEEAEKRMEELNYLKIHPRDQEENQYILFRAERLYEMNTGQTREYIGYWIRRFEFALDRQDPEEIEERRAELKYALDELGSDLE